LAQLRTSSCRTKPPSDLTDGEWAKIGFVAGVLQHIVRRYKFLAEQKHPTIGMALSIIEGTINTCLHPRDDDSLEISTLKKEISMEMKAKEDILLDNLQEHLLLAAYLDPRVKDFRFIRNVELKKTLISFAENQLKEKLEELGGLVPQAPSNPESEFSDLLGIPVDDDEFEAYRRVGTFPLAYLNGNVEVPTEPLAWWRTNDYKFPRLSQLARRYLSFTATAMPCERVFSKGGRFVTKSRCALSERSVALLMFLACNNQHNS
jgi:hypothetical protein